MLASLVKKGDVVRFSGFARKTNNISSHTRAKRARNANAFRLCPYLSY
ncbi:MAG: hypothetical protein U5L45_22810 [Saprospiraceae bacterium]|nr:hypothetical protein [Saprospiraceae bacterium]